MQGFRLEGYYTLIKKIKKIKNIAKQVKTSNKILILIFGIMHLIVMTLLASSMYTDVKQQMKNMEHALKYFHSYMPADQEEYGYFIVFLTLFHGIWVNLFVITLALFLVEIVVILLSNQFKQCTQQISTLEAGSIEEIEKIISEFEKLRDLVNEADNLFIILIGVMITTEIVYTCTMGYLLVIYKFSSWSLLYFGTNVVCEAIHLLLMCVCAAYLNTCAHEFVYALYKKVWLYHKSYIEKQEITMFMLSILHEPVGLTYFGLFTLNKEALLSIFGTLLAYFIIVIQFAQQAVATTNNDHTATIWNYTIHDTTVSTD